MSTRPPAGRLKVPRPPAVAEEEWEGGLRAVGLRRAGVPLVELRLFVPAGSHDLSHPAAASLLSESMLAGTDRHDRVQLVDAVETLGGTISVWFGGDGVTVRASALAANFRPLVTLVGEVLTSATYPDGEVRGDRERLANEVMIALSQPDVLARDEFHRSLFGSHPYGTPMPSPAAIRRVRPAQLRALHGELMAPEGGAVVVVGDVAPRTALRTARELLAPWSRARASRAATVPDLGEVKANGIRVVPREGSVQSNVRIGGWAPARTDPAWPATSLANMAFGGMFTSRLVTNLRERNGYTYSPRSMVDHRRAGSYFAVQADVGRDVTAAALVETRFELGRLAVGGVTAEELDSIRRYAVGAFTIVTATQAGLADTMVSLAAVGVGPGYLSTYPRALAKATKADVDGAARVLLAPADLVTVVVGDAERIVGSLEAVDKVTIKATVASR